MKKSQLLDFISKYHLGGKTEAAQWNTSEDKLSTPFITATKSCMGEIVAKDFTGLEPDLTLGILTTSPLIRQLNTLVGDDNDEVDVHIATMDKDNEIKVVSVEFTEKDEDKYSTKYMCAALKVVPKSLGRTLKNGNPPWDLTFTLNEKHFDKFIKAQAALDTNTFAVIKQNGQYKLILGYREGSQNTSTIQNITVDVKEEIDAINFPADVMSAVMKANSGFKSAKFNVFHEGISQVEIEHENFECIYYILEDE